MRIVVLLKTLGVYLHYVTVRLLRIFLHAIVITSLFNICVIIYMMIYLMISHVYDFLIEFYMYIVQFGSLYDYIVLCIPKNDVIFYGWLLYDICDVFKL